MAPVFRSSLSGLSVRILLAACLFAMMAPSASAKMFFDRFDGDDFVKDGRGWVRFFVDILDDDFRVVPAEQISDVSVFVDDQEILGTYELETVKEANEPIAVSIVIAAHNGYAFVDAESGAPNVLTATQQGYERFMERMTDQDWFSVWYYNEEKSKNIKAWAQNPGSATNAILKDVQTGEKGEGKAPGLFDAVKKAVDDMAEQAETLEGAHRRLVIIMSDGNDKFLKLPKRVTKKIDDIVTTAEGANIKIYALGYTLDTDENLVNLDTLATKTGGLYRRLEGDLDEDGIASELEKLAKELKSQYVVKFTPTEYGGAEAPVNVRMEVKTKSGSMKRQKDGVQWPVKPTDIGGILVLVGVIVGSLLGLFLLVKLFKKIAAARANRPEEVYEEEEFVGPYKGKLTCTGGSYAGAEFFLTEDVTTIGGITGNTIVIQEAGVSKRHAGIKIEEMRFELADFGSTNGTFVNGSKITKQFLRDGDKVQVGECELKFTLK